jgi:hypothetical protein
VCGILRVSATNSLVFFATFVIQKERCHHRLSINIPTKRGKEKSPSDGHCQCEKEMDDHLVACQQFLKESHLVTHLANERTSFLNMNDINDISPTVIIVVL